MFDWLAISLGFWSGRALATGTALAGLCLIHHHHHRPAANGAVEKDTPRVATYLRGTYIPIGSSSARAMAMARREGEDQIHTDGNT